MRSGSPIVRGHDPDHASPCCRSRPPTRSRCSPRWAGRWRRQAWRGALPIPYHLGPGPARVHLKARVRLEARSPPTTSSRRCPGAERPDEWVIRGNHHDAWVNGAADPVSGLVALLEEARAVGELARSGFRPRRTHRLRGLGRRGAGPARLDGMGGGARRELREKAVAYINSDSNSRGFLGIGGSHSLETFVNQVAAPTSGPAEEDRRAAAGARAAVLDGIGGVAEEEARARQRGLAHRRRWARGRTTRRSSSTLGVASLNVGFGGEDAYGQYHSIYDSFDHYTRFMDPDFSYGVALAQTAGRLTLRLAQADVRAVRLRTARLGPRDLRQGSARRSPTSKREETETSAAATSTRDSTRPGSRPHETAGRARAAGAGAVPQLRAPRQRPRSGCARRRRL